MSWLCALGPLNLSGSLFPHMWSVAKSTTYLAELLSMCFEVLGIIPGTVILDLYHSSELLGLLVKTQLNPNQILEFLELDRA